MTTDLHNLMMLDHAEDKLAMSRRHLDKYRRDGLGMKEVAESEGDDMKILSSGDVHFYQQSQPKQEPEQSPARSSFPWKTAIAAAALGAGVPVAGAVGYLLRSPVADRVVERVQSIERDYKIGEVVVEPSGE